MILYSSVLYSFGRNAECFKHCLSLRVRWDDFERASEGAYHRECPRNFTVALTLQKYYFAPLAQFGRR
jgi:hypothetical protein